MRICRFGRRIAQRLSTLAHTLYQNNPSEPECSDEGQVRRLSSPKPGRPEIWPSALPWKVAMEAWSSASRPASARACIACRELALPVGWDAMVGTLAFRDNLIPRQTARILSRLAKGCVKTSTQKIPPPATQDILEAVPKLQAAAITRREETKAVADFYLLVEHVRIRRRQAL